MAQPISLTPKQERFYAKLKKYIAKHKQSPTVAELMEEMTISSPRGVVQYFEALERKGLILRAKGEARGIHIMETEREVPQVEIPVFASAGCDNVMTMAERIFDEYVCVARDLLHGRDLKQVVGIKASGDSMVDAGILDGDYVLCEVTQNIHENDLVVAIIDNFAVIKKLEYANNAVILKPVSSDPQYKPIILHRDFRIFGKVFDVFRAPQKGEIEVVPLYSKA
jgi:repressor LexA